LPCIYHPRLQNTLVNRVLLSGLQLAVKLTGDLNLRARLRHLAALMAEDVVPLSLDRQLMGRVWREMDRRTAAYRPSLILIQMLIQFAGVLLKKSPDQVRLPGFLFDMNRFFQTFLSRFLHENLPGYKVQDEYRLRDMMVYAEGFNPRGLESPTPRPDFVISRRGSIVAILDAKYIDLWHHGPPASVLYQLTVYALSQGLGSSTTILYPTMDAAASESRLDIRHPLNQRIQAQIILRPVHLGQLEQLISHSVSRNNIQHRLGVAKYMIFGEPTGASNPMQVPQ
jgi:5-methylcytosine-specific restriction enzyme subunit McrC